MSRLIIALVPLILAATPTAAQHAGHARPPAARPTPVPTPRPAPRPAPRPRPATPPAAPVQDPHAGHVVPPVEGPATADPHAGHDMSSMSPAPADPHAGHDMSAMNPVPADRHAGHATPAAPQTADPHAGHAMPAEPPIADPHAGHDMSAMNMGPPDIQTSADNPGRPSEQPVPAAALSGPTHAADLVFGAGAMAASRRTLITENGDMRTTAVILDRLEAGFGDDSDRYLWDVQGWSGGDINRFWWKSEGEGDFGGGLEEAELQALFSRAVTPFWDVQAGVRHDVRRNGDDTTHLVLGFQGLAPHWWEVDAAAFLSTEGDLTARVEAEYDQRITQQWILQPRIEIAASAGDIPQLQIGSGLSSIEAGLRLRYEFRKELAPYVGVEWNRSFGDTADYIEARGGETEDVRLIIGLKAWF